MLSLRIITRGLLKGKSLVRIYQNYELMRAPIMGRVLDVGHGGDTAYLDFLPLRTGRTIETIDPKLGSAINFEQDALPYHDAVFLSLRPKARSIYPMGYYFVAYKN